MLLDTTLLADFLRGKKEAIAMVQKLRSGYLYTTEVNAAELIEGTYLAQGNLQMHQQAVFALLAQICVLPLTGGGAMKTGEISAFLKKKGKTTGMPDCLIAGIALENKIRTIVTRNKQHFEGIPKIKVMTY